MMQRRLFLLCLDFDYLKLLVLSNCYFSSQNIATIFLKWLTVCHFGPLARSSCWHFWRAFTNMQVSGKWQNLLLGIFCLCSSTESTLSCSSSIENDSQTWLRGQHTNNFKIASMLDKLLFIGCILKFWMNKLKLLCYGHRDSGNLWTNSCLNDL